MPSKFIHLKEQDFEFTLNIEAVQYVRRTGKVTWVHFYGDLSPLTLRGDSARMLWQFMLDISPTIYIAPDDKNAEAN